MLPTESKGATNQLIDGGFEYVEMAYECASNVKECIASIDGCKNAMKIGKELHLLHQALVAPALLKETEKLRKRDAQLPRDGLHKVHL